MQKRWRSVDGVKQGRWRRKAMNEQEVQKKALVIQKRNCSRICSAFLTYRYEIIF